MPDKQKQQEFLHSFNSDGNLGIFGAASTGKSTVLMNVALSLAVKNSPSMLNYYVIDLGNSALISLARLPHTADYINFDDEEKQRKIKNIIDGEIHGRKKLFGKANVTNLEMYNKTSEDPLPAVIIFVDNYDVVREMGLEEEDFYTRLARDGVSVGIYLCLSASRSNAMKYAIFNSLNVRVSNYMTDPSEVYTIVGRSKYTLGDIKGRGLIKVEESLIMQEYLPVDAQEEFEYVDKIKDLIARISDSNTGSAPKGIPVLPEKLEMYDLMARKNDDDRLALGLDSEEVEVKYLNDANLQVIVGPAESGKPMC